MAHPDRTVACIHRAHLTPGFPIIFAHTKSRLLSVGVFAAFVVTEGGVEPLLVKAKRHSMQEAVTVILELVAFDDGEPLVFGYRQFGGLEQRHALVPERRGGFCGHQGGGSQEERKGVFHSGLVVWDS